MVPGRGKAATTDPGGRGLGDPPRAQGYGAGPGVGAPDHHDQARPGHLPVPGPSAGLVHCGLRGVAGMTQPPAVPRVVRVQALAHQLAAGEWPVISIGRRRIAQNAPRVTPKHAAPEPLVIAIVTALACGAAACVSRALTLIALPLARRHQLRAARDVAGSPAHAPALPERTQD